MHKSPGHSRLIACVVFLMHVGISAPITAVALGLERGETGVSELWFLQYRNDLDLTLDSDGDGSSNQVEGIAGTDPMDPTSRLYVESLEMSSIPEAVLRWPSVIGKRYGVEVSGDLNLWTRVPDIWIGDGEESVATISLAVDGAGPGVTLRRWQNVTESLSGVRTFARAGTREPSSSSIITSLEIAQSSPNEEQFAQQLRGWIIAPADGIYQFWLASDDSSEFWLSTDEDPANAVRVAWIDQWTSFRQWTKYVTQQSVEVQLESGQPYFFEVFHREYSSVDHLSIGWSGPALGLATPEVIAAPHIANTPVSPGDLAAQGRLFFRLRVWDVDSDGDGLTDYEEALLGMDAMNPTTTPRVADRDAVVGMLAATNVVTIGTSNARVYESGGEPAEFVVFRSGNLNPLTVAYSVEGTGQLGVDFVPPAGTVQFGLGATRATVPIVALPDDAVEPAESVILRINADAAYTIGNPGVATITIDDAPDELFIAQLRPAQGVASGGSGTFALSRAGNALFARISLSFSGLSSAAAGAELVISESGENGPVVLTLPPGQITTRVWEFEPVNGVTREEILAAIDAGNLWVRVLSVGVPDGEIIGHLGGQAGWQTMPEPPTPPTAPIVAGDSGDAARFLSQATFGADSSGIAALENGGSFDGWVQAQMTLAPTLHTPLYLVRRAELLASRDTEGWQSPRQQAWWQNALDAPDQLRQRMAFALSQIFVISQFGVLDSDHEGTSRYYDMLVEGAFGNYRDLLEQVTLSPMMGAYLSMMRNRKPDPLTGHEPDENYAREVMQLFSVGLNQLHPDGSLVLDALGMPVPTYTQDDTVGMAHIFTGWGPHYDPINPPQWSNGGVAAANDWFRYGRDPLRPMSFYPAFHDQTLRTVLSGVEIPGEWTGPERMDAALDVLFNHPTTPPFLARQLIQKFVTANPSPGYISRVAGAFADNGSGVRGDLGTTLRAVLLDPEARSAIFLGNAGYGKPYEPILRMTRMLRVFRPVPPRQGDSRVFLNFQYSMPEQAALMSPSVFNFFQPVYRQAGRIADAGLVSPEFQLLGETTVVSQSNLIFGAFNWGIWVDELDESSANFVVQLDLTEALGILSEAGKPPLEAQEGLIDFLDVRFLGGRMSAELRQHLRSGFLRLPGWFDFSDERQRQRVRMAAYLVLTSPEFAVQR